MKKILSGGHWTPSKTARLLPQHKNPGFEIVYNPRGEIIWEYEGREVICPPGSIVTSWPWEQHGVVSNVLPQCELFWIILSTDRPYPRPHRQPQFHPDLSLPQKTGASLVQALKESPQRSLASTPLMSELIRHVVAEYTKPGYEHEARMRNMVKLLLIELARAARKSQPGATIQAGDRRVRGFLKTLEQDCADEWTLERMAETCRLGRTRFSLLVSRQTGDTPLRLLSRYRVEQAKRLLRESPHSITTIGFECGFGSSQYFARVFKEFTGQSPSQFRRKNN